MSVRLKTISGNLMGTWLTWRNRLKGVKWEAYKIANLCAQFTETVSIPTRCTGGRWRYCSVFTRPIGTRAKSERGNLGGLDTPTHLKAQCQICSLNPRVIHSRRSGHRLARSAGVEGDDVECRAKPRVVHLTPQPGRIEVQRMKHDDCRFVWLEGIDGP